jgi:hypothetical protein
MDWVAIDVHIAGDAVTHRLADQFRLRVAEAAGLLTLAFAGMAQHAQDGSLTDITDSQIESWALWHGKRGAFATFFRAQLTDDTGTVRAWEKYNGAAIREARAARERMQAYRARKRSEREANSTANGSGNGTPNGAPNSTANGTRDVRHNLTGPDLTVPNQTTKSSKSGAARPPAKVPKPRPAAPAWAGRLAEEWRRRVGDVGDTEVAKLLKGAVEQRDEGTVLAAMHGWLDARKESKSDPKLKWFAEVAIAWADRVAAANTEPLLDNGWMSPALERETRPGGRP